MMVHLDRLTSFQIATREEWSYGDNSEELVAHNYSNNQQRGRKARPITDVSSIALENDIRPPLEAVTTDVVKFQLTGRLSACFCESATGLQLSIVTTREKAINHVTNTNPVCTHTHERVVTEDGIFP